jgi:hypothetical protein
MVENANDPSNHAQGLKTVSSARYCALTSIKPTSVAVHILLPLQIRFYGTKAGATRFTPLVFEIHGGFLSMR